MQLGSFLLISTGVGAILLGGMVLWQARGATRQLEREEGEIEGDSPAENAGQMGSPGGQSVPTRLLTGVVLLVLGYHLVVWALPATWTPLQWARGLWYWLLAGAGVLVALARGMDHLDEKRLGSDTKDGPLG